MATAQPLFDEILNYPHLPTLPTIAVELLELTSRPDVELSAIERLVQSDQGLATKILRTVNSSFYGLQAPCGSIKRALAYLGLNAVKSLVLGFSLVDLTKTIEDGDQFDFIGYWRRAIYSAAGGRQFAVLFDCGDPDEAFTCGMFQDIGMLASYCVLKQRYSDVQTSVGGDHDRLVVAERADWGFDHTTMGAALAEKWRLPDDVIESIRHHHDPDGAPRDQRDLVRASQLGRMVAGALIADESDRHLCDILARIRLWFGPMKGDVADLLGTINIAAKDLAAVLDQDIADQPDVNETISRANEMMSELQMQAQIKMQEMERVQVDLNAKATTDALTGIGNRAAFDGALHEQFRAAEDASRPMSVLFMDADHFKSVNDTYGHQAGDDVLQGLAMRLVEAAADEGTPYRYGGEEFAVLCPGLGVKQAFDVAERIRAAVAAAPMDATVEDGTTQPLEVTISIGVASLEPGDPNRPGTAEQLLARADKAVYVAKRDGRNCVRHVADCRKPAETTATSVPGTIETAGAPSMSTPGASIGHVVLVEPDALAASLLVALFRKMTGTKVSWFRRPGDLLAWIERGEQKQFDGPTHLVCGCRGADDDALRVVRVVRVTPDLKDATIVVLADSDDEIVAAAARHVGVDACYAKTLVASRLAEWSREVLALKASELLAA
jgi:diguanylate cyclase (GGDEF)-like protein